MGWSLRVGHIFGIPIRIHWSLLFFLGLVLLSSLPLLMIEPVPALMQIFIFLGLFLTVLAHELGHAVVAMRFGSTVADIILTPIGGLARIRRLPEKSWQEVAVAIAGPAVNAVAVLVIALVVGIEPILAVVRDALSSNATGQAAADSPLNNVTTVRDVLAVLGGINFVLGTFNLLPGFPMDGGRVLRGVLSARMHYVKATQIAVNVGKVFAAIFGLYGLYTLLKYGSFGGVVLIAIAALLVFVGTAEWFAVQRRFLLHGLKVTDALDTTDTPSVRPYTSLYECQSMIYHQHLAGLPVVDDTGFLVGWIERDAALNAPHYALGHLRALDVMRPHFPWVAPSDPLRHVLQAMEEHQLFAVPVVEPDGRYKGTLSLGRIAKIIERRIAQEFARAAVRRA